MSNKFLDFAGLSYLIGKLKERFLGKTDTAASATKLAAARKINGVAFDGTSNITVKDDTKLPLSGGTVTGDITVTKLNAVALELSTDTPFVDFHFNSSLSDYTARIINAADGWINIEVNNTSGQSKTLSLGAEGTLVWGGLDIEREYDKVAGGVSFAPSGLQIYTTSITISGIAAGDIITSPTITFPKAFAATPMVVALPSNPHAQVAWYALSSTIVSFQVKNTSSGGLGTVVVNVIVIGGL